ncbi:hypothetical protein ADIARSV_1551 [Arcticibacter svalbardensis MN12-7]|uniref:DUF5017 domain-containing protein n=1 Tax=Arcticibacter svalbardensis MN12-7 TaxID=1150600 RepID=R9H246_9SPHI|nr:hypothetical protein ADIARSV_1551 [Arcticibacter svalbardensis MN12-7]
MEVDTPTFEASLESSTFNVGDTVNFKFSGNADYVYFFSGELGKEYTKRTVFENEVNGSAEFQFTSSVAATGTSTNNINVLVSNDFNSVYDTTNVKKATWVDITDKVTLGTGTTLVSSGIINLAPYQAADKPIFIAYKYLGQNNATVTQKTWTIGGFQFRTKQSDGEVYTNASSFTDGAFANVEFKGDSARWVINSTTLTHLGLAAGNPDDNDWVISKAINLKTAVGDATGVETIKNLTTGYMPTSFQYVYTTPGTYKCTIASVNASAEGRKDKLKEFTIVINP